MKNFSSEEIQKAAEEVKKSGNGDHMFKDPGHKRRTRHKRSSRRKHTKLPKPLQRITSRDTRTGHTTTSSKTTSRQQNTSRRNTSRRVTSRNRQTSMMVTTRRTTSRQQNNSRRNTSRRVTSRRNTSKQSNTFPWAAPIPIRGRFCCTQSQRNNVRQNNRA